MLGFDGACKTLEGVCVKEEEAVEDMNVDLKVCLTRDFLVNEAEGRIERTQETFRGVRWVVRATGRALDQP